ncbi:MAG: hypothetical protein Q8S21_05485 [Candidatus Paracaedibacteraceae bacterium]|nr:hypothetical protein [Candidatus Paracaedibacteraceae bacterium]
MLKINFCFLIKFTAVNNGLLYIICFILSVATECKESKESYFDARPLHERALYTQNPDDFVHTNDLENKQELEMLLVKETSLALNVQNIEESSLVSYIKNYVIEDHSVEESLWTYKIRTVVKTLAILYGATGGIPYINACCKAGHGILFLCVSFSVGNIISSGGATIWAALRTVEAFDPVSKEENFFRYYQNSYYNAFNHLICNALGLISCVPGTYSVYKYNTEKLLVIPGFLNNYFFSTVGYYEFTNSSSLMQQTLSKLYKKNLIDKKADKIKREIVKQVNTNVIPLIAINSDVSNDLFMSNSINASNSSVVEEFVKKVLLMKLPRNTRESSEFWKNRYPKKIVQLASMLFPLSGAVINYLLNYEVANLLTTSSVFCTGFAFCATLPNFMIDVLTTSITVHNLFNIIHDNVNENNTDNFFSFHFPILNLVVPVISVVLASLSLAGGWIVSTDCLTKTELTYLIYILPIMTFMSGVISQSFQMRDVIYNSIIYYYSTFNKEKIGESASRIRRLEKFTSAVSNCNPLILCDFWDNLNKKN